MYQLSLDDVQMLLAMNDNFLIITHKKPDGDTMGSGSALCRMLRQKNKTAYLFDSGEIGKKYMPFCQALFPPEGFAPDFVISVDMADLQLLPEKASRYRDEIQLSIDHHPSNSGFAGHDYLKPEAAATGEVIYEIAQKLKCDLNCDIMEAIYVAVSTDTGCFRYSNTTAQSHMIGAKAIECGVDVYKINREFFESKTFARFKVEREIFEKMSILYDGKFAISGVDNKFISENNISEDDLDNISSLLRNIEGVDCACTVIQQKNGDYKVSLRCAAPVNASEICIIFGGGGHARAAGCTIKASDREDFGQKIIQIIGEQLNA